MIPFSVSDLIKLLDEVPIWRAVAGLPKRLAELERKVTELEAAIKAKSATPVIPEGRICPICGSEMKVTSETAHPTFHFAGVKVHHMECTSCGNQTQRQYTPGKGYR